MNFLLNLISLGNSSQTLLSVSRERVSFSNTADDTSDMENWQRNGEKVTSVFTEVEISTASKRHTATPSDIGFGTQHLAFPNVHSFSTLTSRVLQGTLFDDEGLARNEKRTSFQQFTLLPILDKSKRWWCFKRCLLQSATQVTQYGRTCSCTNSGFKIHPRRPVTVRR